MNIPTARPGAWNLSGFSWRICLYCLRLLDFKKYWVTLIRIELQTSWFTFQPPTPWASRPGDFSSWFVSLLTLKLKKDVKAENRTADLLHEKASITLSYSSLFNAWLIRKTYQSSTNISASWLVTALLMQVVRASCARATDIPQGVAVCHFFIHPSEADCRRVQKYTNSLKSSDFFKKYLSTFIPVSFFFLVKSAHKVASRSTTADCFEQLNYLKHWNLRANFINHMITMYDVNQIQI